MDKSSGQASNTSTLNGSRRRKPRGWIVPVAGVVVIGAVGVSALGIARTLNAGGESADGLDIHRVTEESFEIVVTASGELEAEKQTEIRSELESSADIVELVDEGSRVKKGDLLIKLNDESIVRSVEDQLLSVEEARSELIAAENALAIQLNENEAARRQGELKVELATIDLKKWEEGEDAKRRVQLTTALEKAERNFKRLDEKLKQSKLLYEKDFLSYDDYQRDEIEYYEAEAAVLLAKKDIEVYEAYEYGRDKKQKTSDLEEAQAELERVLKQNESRLAREEADVTNRRRQLAIREERLAKLQEQVVATTLYAPTDGLVVYGTSIGDNRFRSFSGGDGALQIGRTVRPNELLIVLPDTTNMVASVRVHESVAGRIRPGLPATVRVDAIRGSAFRGTVKSVGVLAESGGWRDPNLREYTVKILVDGGNPDQKLKPSMRADAEIVLGEVDDSVAVPVQSIFHEGEVSFVYTPAGGKYQKTPVRVGRRSTTMAEIAAGLNAGDTVLLREPSAGEVSNREITPQAIAAIQPTSEEIAAAKAEAQRQAEALKAASEQEIDVEAVRKMIANNPNIPQERRDEMAKMTDDQVRELAKRFSRGRSQGGGSGGGNRANASE